ncbi:hypothetical protein shim_12090 [Shimia sp. SK013]|uniref:DUF1353 domain-containing protein n=1 Tax=Shimia sp. SK013 TaxID=1389006 RepID=UPI0006B64399|nr:DUF1353 domain-containing protein [Shimia sp. SK013]KPA22919.1 hypothetical protein shim_12090 [Shimia sp. SK013]
MWRFFACVVLAIGACAPVNYDAVTKGEFDGLVQLYWVGGNTGSAVGDGKFLYFPDPTSPLRYTSNDQYDHKGKRLVIEPPAFFTDGGSVPRMVQGVPGFNAWAFGPAYIVHDWAFEAHRCLNYKEKKGDTVKNPDIPTPEMEKLKNMSFKQSAELMAETIKTLLPKNTAGGPGGVIASFTAGPISYAAWQDEKSCAEIRAPKDPAPEEIRQHMARPGLSQAQREVFELEDGRQVKLIGVFKVR